MADISYEAKGTRDIYWCYFLNEPVIVQYREDDDTYAYCQHCDGGIVDCEQHTFLFHIERPDFPAKAK